MLDWPQDRESSFLLWKLARKKGSVFSKTSCLAKGKRKDVCIRWCVWMYHRVTMHLAMVAVLATLGCFIALNVIHSLTLYRWYGGGWWWARYGWRYRWRQLHEIIGCTKMHWSMYSYGHMCIIKPFAGFIRLYREVAKMNEWGGVNLDVDWSGCAWLWIEAWRPLHLRRYCWMQAWWN